MQMQQQQQQQQQQQESFWLFYAQFIMLYAGLPPHTEKLTEEAIAVRKGKNILHTAPAM